MRRPRLVIGGIGIDHLAHQIGVFPQLLPATGIDTAVPPCHLNAQPDICGGLNRNIDAKIQRVEQHTGSPVLSIMMMASGTHAADGGNNRRNVVDFHGDGAWRFQKHDFSVWLQMLNDIGTNQRIKPRCRYAQFAEDPVQKS